MNPTGGYVFLTILKTRLIEQSHVINFSGVLRIKHQHQTRLEILAFTSPRLAARTRFETAGSEANNRERGRLPKKQSVSLDFEQFWVSPGELRANHGRRLVPKSSKEAKDGSFDAQA